MTPPLGPRGAALGTYAGIGHPAVIDHLLSLGVTACRADCRCTTSSPSTSWSPSGLTNYWGY
ncbi:hypothetical protein [Nonomuraea dietziae]|uniref:hypothetical protein n=1 Tax=Nonomuraea dietziae TaxID=65515 RepID=UPI003CD07969